MPETAFVRTTSHRARQKLADLLGYDPQGFYRWDKRGDWREVPAERLAEALAINGVHKSQRRPEHREYIDWS